MCPPFFNVSQSLFARGRRVETPPNKLINKVSLLDYFRKIMVALKKVPVHSNSLLHPKAGGLNYLFRRIIISIHGHVMS